MKKYSERDYSEMLHNLVGDNVILLCPGYEIKLASMLTTEWLIAIVDDNIELYGAGFVRPFLNACKEELAERIILDEEV